MAEQLGISGRITERFQASAITPLLALVGLLLGLFAILVTPREEEPQINVTFADVFIPFPGASATEVEQLVAGPAEQVLSEMKGIKHVYSVSRPGLAVVTVQFQVGEDQTDAIVRLYSKIYSNQDWLPPNLGVGQPLIKPKGIDDVPIITATLWSRDETQGAFELGKIAHAIEQEIKRVPGTRDVYTVGAPAQVARVVLDPQALAGFNVDLDTLRQALQAANHTRDDIAVTHDNAEILVQAGTLLMTVEEVGDLVVGLHGGRPVFLRDVATITRGPEPPRAYVWLGAGPLAEHSGVSLAGTTPAVTIAVAKQEGINAVEVAERVIDRFAQLEGTFIPDGVAVTVTRNYGATADAKAQKLIQKLTFATLSVIVLVVFAIGWRESIIVGAAIVVTLPTATVAGSIVITNDINFTITTAGLVQIVVFDEWVTSDGSNSAISGSAIAPGIAYSVNGGSPAAGIPILFLDNGNGTALDLTANDGFLAFLSSSVAVNDTFTLKAASYSIAAGSLPPGFNPQGSQTFAGNAFLTDAPGNRLSANAAVPEPGTTLLGALAGLALLRRRRR